MRSAYEATSRNVNALPKPSSVVPLPGLSMVNGCEGRVDAVPDKGLDESQQTVHGNARQVHEDEALHLVVLAKSVGRMDHMPIVGEARGHPVVVQGELDGWKHRSVDVPRASGARATQA